MRSSPLYRGYLAENKDRIVELPRIIEDSGTSLKTTRTFKGQQTYILNLGELLKDSGYTVTYTQGPLWTLTATIGALLTDNDNPNIGAVNTSNGIVDWNTEPELANWSLGYREEQKDILENVYITIVSDLKDSDPTMLKSVKEWNENGPKDTHPAYRFTAVSSTERQKNLQRAEKLYQLITDGVKTAPVEIPVAKCVMTVPKLSPNLPGYFVDNGEIISVDRMASEPKMESWYYGILVDVYEKETFGYEGLEAEGSAIDGSSVPVVVGKKFGFRKKVNMEPAPDSCVSVTIEYEFGLWATDLYGIPT